ncbi:MAG: phosphatidylglycerophosphatase A [Rhodospirillales bacterium]|nr:phosphatidylglycerophosphatase A [Rhodospirillales bacterium]
MTPGKSYVTQQFQWDRSHSWSPRLVVYSRHVTQIRERRDIFDGEASISTPATFWGDPARVLATGFGLGFLPWAPGTWASLAALVVGYGIASASGRVGLAIAGVVATLVGVWAAGRCVRSTPDKDPSFIVIDEISGQWLVMVVAGVDPWLCGLAFVFFRIADIWKPWPVSWVDRRFRSGLGVMLDDLAAAVYAGIVVSVVSWAWRGGLL